jgi:hypothetical protein
MARRGRPPKPKTAIPDFLAAFKQTGELTRLCEAPSLKYENLPCGADPWIPSRFPVSNKKMNLLAGRLWVSVETARQFLGIGRRAVQIAMKKGKLEWKNTPTGRLISTKSLLRP